MGCDSAEMYGGDKELTALLQKDSMSPFDLLCGETTAEKVDLWNEYAVATKGLSCFRFTPGFKDVIDEYFEKYPNRNPSAYDLPAESLVASLDQRLYHLLYRNFKLEELKEKVVEGCDSLCSWLRKTLIELGVPDSLVVSGGSG